MGCAVPKSARLADLNIAIKECIEMKTELAIFRQVEILCDYRLLPTAHSLTVAPVVFSGDGYLGDSARR